MKGSYGIKKLYGGAGRGYGGGGRICPHPSSTCFYQTLITFSFI